MELCGSLTLRTSAKTKMPGGRAPAGPFFAFLRFSVPYVTPGAFRVAAAIALAASSSSTRQNRTIKTQLLDRASRPVLKDVFDANGRRSVDIRKIPKRATC